MEYIRPTAQEILEHFGYVMIQEFVELPLHKPFTTDNGPLLNEITLVPIVEANENEIREYELFTEAWGLFMVRPYVYKCLVE